jgi:hypothetical protein
LHSKEQLEIPVVKQMQEDAMNQRLLCATIVDYKGTLLPTAILHWLRHQIIAAAIAPCKIFSEKELIRTIPSKNSSKQSPLMVLDISLECPCALLPPLT